MRQVHLKMAWAGLLLLLGGSLAWAALSLAAQHPAFPLAAPVTVLLLLVGISMRPQMLWFLLPAALPVMNFAPWTGWWLLDESDVMVLACLAGAFGRWGLDVWRDAPRQSERFPVSFAVLWSALALTLVLGVWRGFADAGAHWASIPSWNEAMYAGYDSPWNTWRVAKSTVWALLLGLLLHAPARSTDKGISRRVAQGMVVGLALVVAIALWERAVYAGMLDFSRAYRTSAWFWEMHVGGGAIDAYLAMSVPFAAWAIWTSPTAWRWAGANVLMALSVYAVLTTYSRGVYLAVFIALLFMGLTAWFFKLIPAAGPLWGRRTLLAMAVTLLLESALVLGGGTFMADRLASSDVDLVGRVQHWRSGLSLLKTPSAWATGLGMGRFPAHYSREVEDGQYPGQASWHTDESQRAHVLLSSGLESGRRVDVFALTQRVELADASRVRLRLRATSMQSSNLLVSLCERHLLYDFSCQRRWVTVQPAANTDSGWIEVHMGADIFKKRQGAARLREVVLALSPAQPRQTIRIDGVELWGSTGPQQLLNADFSKGLQHWLPMAKGQFQPWHVDNLYLDVLIERGLLGMLVCIAWVLYALTCLGPRLLRADSTAWVLTASVLGISTLGVVISVTEVPRVSLILMILLWSGGGFRGQIAGAPTGYKL